MSKMIGKLNRLVNKKHKTIDQCKGECRICQEEELVSELLNPCKCSGSIKYIHFGCLVNCIETKNSTICEICQSDYHGIKTITHTRTFLEFLKLNPAIRNEFIFAMVLILLLQVSMLCQYWKLSKLSKQTPFWIHAIIQLTFALFYFGYLYCIYVQWAPENRLVKVVRH